MATCSLVKPWRVRLPPSTSVHNPIISDLVEPSRLAQPGEQCMHALSKLTLALFSSIYSVQGFHLVTLLVMLVTLVVKLVELVNLVVLVSLVELVKVVELVDLVNLVQPIG